MLNAPRNPVPRELFSPPGTYYLCGALRLTRVTISGIPFLLRFETLLIGRYLNSTPEAGEAPWNRSWSYRFIVRIVHSELAVFWISYQTLGRKPSVSGADFTLPAVSDMNVAPRSTLHVPIEPK